MADIPEDSNVDTESDGVGLGEYDFESDGDNDKDEDYVDQAPIPSPTESDEDHNKVEEQAAVEILETAPSHTKQKKKARSCLELQIT